LRPDNSNFFDNYRIFVCHVLTVKNWNASRPSERHRVPRLRASVRFALRRTSLGMTNEGLGETQGPSTACVGSLRSPAHFARDDSEGLGETQGPSTACVGSLRSPAHFARDDTEGPGETQGPSTACVGSLRSPTHLARDDSEFKDVGVVPVWGLFP
jgi:hypothetical protein